MKFQLALRRMGRLSPKKKAAAACFAVLFVLVVVAAYSRNPWLLGVLVVAFTGVVVITAMRVDRLLRSARRAARSAPMNPRPLEAQKRPGALAWWGMTSKIPNPKLVQRLTKLRSVDGRDILVSSVTSGAWSWADMAAGLEMYRIGGKSRETVQKVLNAAHGTMLLHVGDLCYRQNILNDDILNASTLYTFVYQKFGAEPFQNKRRGEFFLDALARTGQGAEVIRLQGLYDSAEMNANDLHLYRANAANPFKDTTADAEVWLREINEIYERAGLSRLTLRKGTAPAFLRLGAEVPEPVTDGPLVSIVMPVYQPDEYTDLAIQSAINQSYRNIEIIIVDDGSVGGAADRLNKWAAEDRRIKVVLNGQNSGAYSSRNVGYSMASGEFLTIFDGDDWQHPQKIERLVRVAGTQPDRRLVSASWTRTDEDLFFQYRGWRGAFITPAHVSTMFHVETIRERLGYWDSVRKAADTEFILRYQALVNSKEPLEVSKAPMTLSLVGTSNLSIEDFRLGYRSPDRVAYRDSYEHWHKKILSGKHSGYLPFPQAQRAFPAPLRFLPDARQSLDLDILFVGDFGDDSGRSQLMFDHLRSANEPGLRIGLMHFPSLLHADAIDKSFSTELLETFAEGRLHRVEITDRVTSKIVNIYDPTAFQYSRELRSGHEAGHVEIWASEPPYSHASDEHKYGVGAVERNLMATFGGPVHWSPSDAATEQVLLGTRCGWSSNADGSRGTAPAGSADNQPDEFQHELASSNAGPSR
ncbi:glycosyltransferase family 2 protein [Arthrobacter sp. 9MFCol3.1]|uniref:glycosyltransferase family 2 protein n=1 Tax=Arthrobacter sp. 9MFCol3.1 TaxID=1150398 RepID=UPI0009E027CC|nr:glycosyltransferase family A protein [Arthrobacter sp. 9MFCol3.1]